jgi:hypothetical protein
MNNSQKLRLFRKRIRDNIHSEQQLQKKRKFEQFSQIYESDEESSSLQPINVENYQQNCTPSEQSTKTGKTFIF